MRRYGGWVIAIVAVMAGECRAQDRLPSSLPKVGLDQRLNEQVPAELMFRDETGARVRIGDYFREKPIILVLAYYRCPMLCNQVLHSLVDSLRPVTLEPGKDFHVVVVSFDPREQPELAAAKKASILAAYRRPGTADGWPFLTGERESIDQLTSAVGFRYAYDETIDQFAHASGIMLVSPEGKLARYFYGLRYPPRDLHFSLIDASQGQVGTATQRLLLFCYRYDPSTGRYTPAVMNLVRLGGVLTLLLLATFVWLTWRRGSRSPSGEAAASKRG